ncbi:MAG TPA: NAD-binding protein [Desulfovibrio sp.]|uniref:NAD-binding protein n=1 Tax=Desulfovibrio sp. TaxID=885 RepID=UPI002D24A0B5|nr:NAD-binding protein [Desulfovibrio sp.]HZF62238.1 NAD-binding protein [Desulfovibrio sp.]
MTRKSRAIAITIFFVTIWFAGMVGFLMSENRLESLPDTWSSLADLLFDAGYRSLQMFVLNFELESKCRVHWLLQVTRFAAPIFGASAVLWSLSHPLRQFVHLCWQRFFYSSKRVIVFGYGPVGQAVARRYAHAVTAVDRTVDAQRANQARTDHILLIEGNGTSDELMVKIGLSHAHRVFIAFSNDMESLDAARAVQAHVRTHMAKTGAGPDIRVLLRDPEIVREISDESTSCTGTWKEISAFALPQMVAEELCQTARFDRAALDAKQENAHLVLFGYGAQGEAIAVEFLLTAWRVGLKPPVIDICDCKGDEIRSRFIRLAPALLLDAGNTGALPENSAPQVYFHTMDIKCADYASDPCMAEVQKTPVTAYVITTSDDTVNVKAALALETAMQLRRVDAAPIFVRIWNGNLGNEADPGFDPVGMIRSFGSLERIVAYGTAFEDDPDLFARTMHKRYRIAGQIMHPDDPKFSFNEGEWNTFDETYRVSNRRLIRHAEQKLEDLGVQWRRKSKLLPVVDPEAFMNNAQSLEQRVIQAAIVEHDRWMTDRALDGWFSAGRYDASLRDNQRRIHPCITEWNNLDEHIQNYDSIFLRALIAGGKEPQLPDAVPSAGAYKCAYIWLAAGEQGDGPTIIESLPVTESTTEVIVGFGNKFLNIKDATASVIKTQLRQIFDRTKNLCRLRIVFWEPPKPTLLRMVKALFDFDRKMLVEISTTWSWKRGEGPAVAFAGHRDLTRLGSITDLKREIQAVFIRAVFENNCCRLVVGYAPGADRMAVACWNGLGLPKPQLVFPFGAGPLGTDFATEDPKVNSSAEIFDQTDLQQHAGNLVLAQPAEDETGHQAQARMLLDQATILVALWDGVGCDQLGGTGDTVMKAQSLGIPVCLVTESPPNNKPIYHYNIEKAQ